MKKVHDVMTSRFPVAAGTLSVRAALALMREHGVEAVPVVEEGTLRGMVSYLELSGHHPNRLLFDVPLEQAVVAEPEMSLAAAYELADGLPLTHFPVVSDGHLVGIVSRAAIQTSLGISADPLTGLPWADSLRERAVSYLSQGQEIVILFMDIDDFRLFNKEYGHVVGDRVIVAVAKTLEACLDPVLDFTCRYAGDEFAVVTTRTLEEAEELAALIKERISEISVEGMGHPIEISIGLRGGRRTKEREGIHYAATVDDLINLASKASTRVKSIGAAEVPTAPVVSPPAPEMPIPSFHPNGAEGRPAISGLKLRSSGTRVEVEVRLTRGDVTFAGSANGPSNTQAILRLVSEATLQAANLFLPESYLLTLDMVERLGIGEDKNLIAVAVTLSGPEGIRVLAGAAIVKHDLYRTVVEATLHAINRFTTKPSLLAQPNRN